MIFNVIVLPWIPHQMSLSALSEVSPLHFHSVQYISLLFAFIYSRLNRRNSIQVSV